MTEENVFGLGCAVQCYAWGKPGTSSEVASLSESGNPNFKIDNDKPYAELWMGTHPKGPSVGLTSGTPLSAWVAEHPACLGASVHRAFPDMAPGQLPFLFKVLSVAKSLSIQAHPNKSHAERLHADKPDKYPDPNHKPEMAIALTPFKAMCGFRPKDEIHSFITSIPELGSIMGASLTAALGAATNEGDVKSAVRDCFTALMTCPPDVVNDKLNALVSRLKAQASRDDLSELLLRLSSEFPGDGGCFCIYFLNVLDLQPGDAIFLRANLPHAYLAGDCIECMACSDNVVRAGLTPKFKDVDVLCSMLDYHCLPAAENLFTGRKDETDSNVTVFDPPVPDFAVMKIEVPAGSTTLTLAALDSASILLVIEGDAQGTGDKALSLRRGSVLFIAANQSVGLAVGAGGLRMFRAYCSG